MRKASSQFKGKKLIPFVVASMAASLTTSSAYAWICTPVDGSDADRTASACGFGSRAYGVDSIAYGDLNLVNGNGAVAFGRNNLIGDNAGPATAIGQNNGLFGGSVGIGKENVSDASDGVVIGYYNVIGQPTFTNRSSNSVVIGSTNQLRTTTNNDRANSILIGDRNRVFSAGSMAFGQQNIISAANPNSGLYSESTSLGNNNTIYGDRSVAFGSKIGIGASQDNSASDSIAIGSSAYVTGNNSTALGSNTRAFGENSTAIGTGAVASRNNQISIGTATSTYTAAGIASAESKAAQIGSTQFVTTDVSGNLASSAYGPQDIAGLNNSVAGLNNSVGVLGANVSALSNRVDGNQREARQGIALAASMAQAPMPSAAGKTTWKFNNGFYKNYAATSLSLSHRLPTAVPIALTGGVAIGYRNSALFTAGLQGEF